MLYWQESNSTWPISEMRNKLIQFRSLFQSLKTRLPVFDESVASARINQWLSASMDLSKEGLCENPVDGYTSLQTHSNLGDDGDHGYSHVIRSPADVHRSEQNMAGTGASPDSGTNLMGEYDFPISSIETNPFAVCISKTMIFSNFCRGNMIEIGIKSI